VKTKFAYVVWLDFKQTIEPFTKALVERVRSGRFADDDSRP